jgi:predicted nucleic acid-binding protein
VTVRRVYLESSALARILVEGDSSLATTLTAAEVYTSALTIVETTRAIRRARREGRISKAHAIRAERQLVAIESSCVTIALTSAVLGRARVEFPVEPVRTLDALHLASLQIVSEKLPLDLVSCDERVRRNAVALGFEVSPR